VNSQDSAFFSRRGPVCRSLRARAVTADFRRLEIERADILRARVKPFDAEFERVATSRDSAAAFAFSEQCGREAAMDEQDELFARAEELYERMRAIPALTQAGRAAKVRALIAHVHALDDTWKGRSDDLDWGKGLTRALLGELAGMSEDELAAA
jgi:hypothetical protein